MSKEFVTLPKETHCCVFCRFWKPFNDDTKFGHCRRYPPVLCERQMQDEWDEIGGQSGDVFSSLCTGYVFPATVNSNWCGEFQQKLIKRSKPSP